MTAGSSGPSVLLQTLRESSVERAERLRERVATLYESQREPVYRLLVASGLPPAVAQEVTQDVFLSFFVAIQGGGEVKSETSWIFSVAGKKAVDYWRREGQARWVELKSAPDDEELFHSSEPTPESNAVRAQQLRRVADAMLKLPGEQRLCILLRAQGLRYREIAEILGVAISTTSEWLNTAVERLRGAVRG